MENERDDKKEMDRWKKYKIENLKILDLCVVSESGEPKGIESPGPVWIRGEIRLSLFEELAKYKMLDLKPPKHKELWDGAMGRHGCLVGEYVYLFCMEPRGKVLAQFRSKCANNKLVPIGFLDNTCVVREVFLRQVREWLEGDEK